MRRQPPPKMPATAIPTVEDMLRVWRSDRCIQHASAAQYIRWIKWFRFYLDGLGLEERAQLTREGARRFVEWYGQHRGVDHDQLARAPAALRALHRVYQVMCLQPPPWLIPLPPAPPGSALLREYANHLTHHRGNPPVTVQSRLTKVSRFLEHLAHRGKTWSTMTLSDIDDFLVSIAERFARSTVADFAGCIRSFSRFLLATGRTSVDLADSVISPVQPRFERPRRSLLWEDIQRLLGAVDRSTARGLRDYALLLMMSTYGLGAGEAIRLQFDDIDWVASTIRATRPKTGVRFTLPLLPAVAQALATYLRDGRPRNTPTRHIFIALKTPFGPLSGSSPVRHILVKHAKAAGLNAPYLGTHVLRFSNAARQVDLGIRPRILSDLFGHRDSESISAYVRIATETLRDISLPVPT
jgi:integrase/recombinase XerD